MGIGATYGAVTGALVIIGLKHAKLHGIKFIFPDKTDELAALFIQKFEA